MLFFSAHFLNSINIGCKELKNLLNMLEDRNLLAHQYDNEIAQELSQKIVDTYNPVFKTIVAKIEIQIKEI